VELDAMAVSPEPLHAFLVEVVARTVIDDEEDLPARIVPDEPLQKCEEGLTVEDVVEAEEAASIVQGDCPIDMRGLASAERVYARLNAYP
jgi:hypothetical protein